MLVPVSLLPPFLVKISPAELRDSNPERVVSWQPNKVPGVGRCLALPPARDSALEVDGAPQRMGRARPWRENETLWAC